MIKQAQKNELVAAMRGELAEAQGVVFVDYTGLTVAEVEDVRKKARAANIKYRVVKNTLLCRALSGTSVEDAAKFLKGTPTGVVLGAIDPVSTAKLVVDFTKAGKHLRIKGGILENKAISASETESLSKMATRDELLAEVLGLALGPARRLLAQVKNPAGRVVGAVEKLAEEGATANAQ